MTTQLKQDLIATRDFLATHEWRQGPRDRSESYCAVEALCKVAGPIDLGIYEGLDRVAIARAALEESLGIAPYTGGLVLWNDQDGRTKDEVLALFDKAIEATP